MCTEVRLEQRRFTASHRKKKKEALGRKTKQNEERKIYAPTLFQRLNLKEDRFVIKEIGTLPPKNDNL